MNVIDCQEWSQCPEQQRTWACLCVLLTEWCSLSELTTSTPDSRAPVRRHQRQERHRQTHQPSTLHLPTSNLHPPASILHLPTFSFHLQSFTFLLPTPIFHLPSSILLPSPSYILHPPSPILHLPFPILCSPSLRNSTLKLAVPPTSSILHLYLLKSYNFILLLSKYDNPNSPVCLSKTKYFLNELVKGIT